MDTTSEFYYRALLARDPHFDGVFFVGVTSTGIYCRPVCPARTPRRDRCLFFDLAAAAERQGYRPCLRCRPELAPGFSPMELPKNTARRVVARIQGGALDNEGSLESLASEFDLTSRHLRRVVREELGVTPVELAQSRRLLLAKQLLSDTTLPMIQVAHASGFASVRRFNDTFRRRYRLSPTELRKTARRGNGSVESSTNLRLCYRAPLAWKDLLGFLEARAVGGVERVTAESYERTVRWGDHCGTLKVTAVGAAELRVRVGLSLTPVLSLLIERLRSLFDLDARPDVIDGALSQDPLLRPLVRARPGMRVPGAFDPFELGWRAILGQQVSVKGATTLATRFAGAFGRPMENASNDDETYEDSSALGLTHSTPSCDDVARSTPAIIARIGLPRARAATVHALAQLFAESPRLLARGCDVERARARLLELPGVGPWTADYIAMRGCRDPDAFPDGDLVLKKVLNETRPSRVKARAEVWRPWRAYAALHLWRGSSELSGGDSKKSAKASRKTPPKTSRKRPANT